MLLGHKILFPLQWQYFKRTGYRVAHFHRTSILIIQILNSHPPRIISTAIRIIPLRCAPHNFNKTLRSIGPVYPALVNYIQFSLPYQLGSPQSSLFMNTQNLSRDPSIPKHYILTHKANFPILPPQKRKFLSIKNFPSVQPIDGTSHEHLRQTFLQQKTENLQMIPTKGKEH